MKKFQFKKNDLFFKKIFFKRKLFFKQIFFNGNFYFYFFLENENFILHGNCYFFKKQKFLFKKVIKKSIFIKKLKFF
jgi:hypothetical protein